MQLSLTPIEARIIGALIEKEITTPDYYPLSLNSLANACNQKSNRDPVMHLEEHEIRKALNHLEYQSLVRSVSGTDSRVTKFEHRLQDAFNFYRPEVAIICELLLRGPQTPGLQDSGLWRRVDSAWQNANRLLSLCFRGSPAPRKFVMRILLAMRRLPLVR